MPMNGVSFFNEDSICHKQTVGSGDPGQCIWSGSGLLVYVPQKDTKLIWIMVFTVLQTNFQCGTQTQKTIPCLYQSSIER